MPTALPVPLSERVEFGSPGWVQAARAFLVPRVKGLRGARFSVCETYTDPPPHLSADPISIHIVVDDGEATVDFGAREDVDFRVHADYTKAFAVAAAVYGHEPHRQGRLLRELTTRSGPVFDVHGSLDAASAELQGVLGGLHDHLARRTVMSPDLAHRIEHLGLTEHVADLDRDGYTILENAFSSTLADELAAELCRLIDEGAPPNLAAANLLARGPLFEEAAVHPWLLALAEHLLGPGFVLEQLLGFAKTTGADTHKLHSDYVLIPEPFPEFCLNVTCIWALQDFTATSGPTTVVPGSFRHRRHPDPASGVGTTKIVMPKGSIALWHGATWHAAAIRDDPGNRVTLHNTYARPFLRAFDGYADIEPSVVENNPPIVSTLLGLDDPFGKNSDAGPNAEHLRYARRNYSATGY